MTKTGCIIITGGDSGLGEELCKQFEETGETIFSVDKKSSNCTQNSTQLIKTIAKKYDIRLLINNASVEQLDWIENITNKKATDCVTTNILGYFYMARDCVKYSMAKSKHGMIINVSSIAGKVPMRASCLYNVTKAAQIMMTKQMGRELSRHDILTVGVNVGKIKDTDMTKRVEKKILKVRGWTKEYADKYQYAYIPAGRPTTKKDVAKFIFNLYKNKDYYLLGSVIDFAGGHQ